MERKPKQPKQGRQRFIDALNELALRLFVIAAILVVLELAVRRPAWLGSALRSLLAVARALGI